MVYATAPSTMVSWTPVTVTVWGVWALADVNVSEVGLTAPSVVSLLVSGTVTSAVGTVFSRTVNVAVPPASVVVSPPVGVTVKPGVSLSTMVTSTLGMTRPL